MAPSHASVTRVFWASGGFELTNLIGDYREASQRRTGGRTCPQHQKDGLGLPRIRRVGRDVVRHRRPLRPSCSSQREQKARLAMNASDGRATSASRVTTVSPNRQHIAVRCCRGQGEEAEDALAARGGRSKRVGRDDSECLGLADQVVGFARRWTKGAGR